MVKYYRMGDLIVVLSFHNAQIDLCFIFALKLDHSFILLHNHLLLESSNVVLV